MSQLQAIISQVQGVIQPIVQGLTVNLPILQSLVNNLSTQLGGLLGKRSLISVEQLIQQVQSQILPIVNQIQSGLASLPALGSLLTGLQSQLGSLLGKRDLQQFLPLVESTIQQVLQQVQVVVGSFPAIQSLVNNLQSQLGSLLGKRSLVNLDQLFQQVQSTIVPIVNQIQSGLASLPALGSLLTGLQSQLGSLLGKRSLNVQNLIDQYLPLVQSTLQQGLQQVQVFLPIVQGFLPNVDLQSIVNQVSSSLTGLLGRRDVWDDLLNVAISVGTAALPQILGGLLSGLLGKRGVFDGLFASLGDIVNQVTGTVSTVVGSLGQVGGVLLDSVTPHLQDLQDQLTNHALNAAQSLLGTLAGISGTLQG